MRYIVFDTETTGLLENSLMPLERQPHIIELFMLLCEEDGEEIAAWHSLFKPPVAITDEITRITGIRNVDVIDAPRFADRAGEIEAFLDRAGAGVAHNLSFDWLMLINEFKRLARVPAFLEKLELICTVEATEHLKGFRLSLTALHELLFEDKFEGAHRAEEDVRANAKCFFELKRRGEV